MQKRFLKEKREQINSSSGISIIRNNINSNKTGLKGFKKSSLRSCIITATKMLLCSNLSRV